MENKSKNVSEVFQNGSLLTKAILIVTSVIMVIYIIGTYLGISLF